MCLGNWNTCSCYINYIYSSLCNTYILHHTSLFALFSTWFLEPKERQPYKKHHAFLMDPLPPSEFFFMPTVFQLWFDGLPQLYSLFGKINLLHLSSTVHFPTIFLTADTIIGLVSPLADPHTTVHPMTSLRNCYLAAWPPFFVKSKWSTSRCFHNLWEVLK